MKNFSYLMFGLLLLAPASLLADQVTCESQDNRRAECNMDTRGEVRLIRQLSHTRCVEGENWGLFKHSIWVDDGCRGVFESTGGGHREGQGHYARENNNSYGENLPTRVTCESQNNQREVCDMDTRGEVRLIRQLSHTRCVEDENWGLFKHSIWVDDGCRASFETTKTSGQGYASNEPRSGQIAACNAVEDRYGRVVSYTALKPGAWEIILEYNDGQYVCNVEGNNRVTYFERLR